MIDFECQQYAVSLLMECSEKDKHSILISGIKGCGKTYLANWYASLLGITDVVQVAAKVDEIRDTFDSLNSVDNDVLLIVENLDVGRFECSYALLKQLEEPRSNIYIVVTCRTIMKIPDTVLSRCMVCHIQVPTKNDVLSYESYNYDKRTFSGSLRACISAFSDVDEMYRFSEPELSYIIGWRNLDSKCKQPCKSIAWGLNHFENGKEIDSDIIIRYIMHNHINNNHIVKCCLACIDVLSERVIPSYVALSKFALDIKYCE